MFQRYFDHFHCQKKASLGYLLSLQLQGTPSYCFTISKIGASLVLESKSSQKVLVEKKEKISKYKPFFFTGSFTLHQAVFWFPQARYKANIMFSSKNQQSVTTNPGRLTTLEKSAGNSKSQILVISVKIFFCYHSGHLQ